MSSILEQFNASVAEQTRQGDTGARQVNGRYELSDVGEARIAEAVAEYDLLPRPATVAKVDGMIADWQAKKGSENSGKGLSVYSTGTVNTRGFTL